MDVYCVETRTQLPTVCWIHRIRLTSHLLKDFGTRLVRGCCVCDDILASDLIQISITIGLEGVTLLLLLVEPRVVTRDERSKKRGSELCRVTNVTL